ncbi:MAG: VWA domain-containing protein [Flavobacteriales bacterium]|nr:VWA domain-containing protein [Flavobacteriales bacterium]
MSFITEYPIWFLVFCIAAGLLYAFILYRKDTNFEDKNGLKWTLSIIRAISVTAISFFLLGPLLRSLDKTVEKPIIVFAQDNSGSIILNKDSSIIKNEFLPQFQEILNSFGENYEVLSYSFGEEVNKDGEIDFSDKQTDISFLFDEVYNRLSNRNLGAIILSSDGIYNRGTSPIYRSKQLNVPLYTIALGDTTQKRDLILQDVAHNRLAYLGNSFPLEVIIRSNDLEGKQARLKVAHEGKVLVQQDISIDKKNFLTSVPIKLDATKTGKQRFNISLSPIAGEFIKQNNYRTIYIDVLDSRQKVLLLANSPHPDIAAIQSSITSNSNYEVEIKMADDPIGNINDFQLVIFHQLPSRSYRMDQVISQSEQLRIPRLFVLGAQNDYSNLESRNLGLSVERFNGTTNEVHAGYNSSFSLFKLGDDIERKLNKFPPLTSPFGNYKVGGNAESLFTQRVGQVSTSDPLFVFTEINEQKNGFVVGEGFWKWRLFDQLENGDHDFSDNIMQKTVQFLSARKDKRLFRVYGKNEFKENEAILMDAELYNESYEAINDPDVEITFKNENDATFNFTFSKTENGYRLNAGTLPAGEYNYTAKTELNDQVLTSSGRISVLQVLAEVSNTTADHQLLYNLANNSNGKMYYPDQLEELKQEILARKEIVPVSYTRQKLSELIDLKWPFFLILLLLSIEWFFRKRHGAY